MATATRRFYSNTAAVAKLTAGINNIQTTIAVDTVAGLPTSFPFSYTLERDGGTLLEIVEVQSIAALVLTVIRGVDGSTAQAHAINTRAEHTSVAKDYDLANLHASTTSVSTAHGMVVQGDVTNGYVDLSSPQTIGGTKTFSGVLTLTGTTPTGVAVNSLSEQLQTNVNLSGGGTLTTNVSGAILWSARFIVISSGYGTHYSTDGSFDIIAPAPATVITGVGGAANITVAGDGTIPLGSWQSLYYILPIGSAHTSVTANFRVASFSAALEVPPHWVLIAQRNDDASTIKWGSGFIQDFGGSMDTTKGFGRNQFVTLADVQTIAGAKTFSAAAVFSSTVNTVGNLSENGNRVYSSANANLSVTTPAAIAAAGAVGVGTTYARADHVHAGVVSVAGRAGAVTLTAADIGAGTFAGSFFFSSNLSLNGTNAGLELGASSSNTPFIDFHSGATPVDYDVRLIASGGTGATGAGTLSVYAASVVVQGTLNSTGTLSENGNRVYSVANPPPSTERGRFYRGFLAAA